MEKMYQARRLKGFLFSGEGPLKSEPRSARMKILSRKFLLPWPPANARRKPSTTRTARSSLHCKRTRVCRTPNWPNRSACRRPPAGTARQLELDGYIDGYVALVNQRMLGYADIVILEVTLDRHEDDALGRFGAELAALPEVLEAYLVSGEYDYWIKVAVDGTAGYERFLREKLYRISSIRHSRSMFALRCMKDVPSIQV
jgi:Lrp/AsnC family leucine-responsive transcriptional regulator